MIFALLLALPQSFEVDETGWKLAGGSPWNFEALAKAPAIHPAPGFEAKGVKAFYYDGLPWQGKPTRVFAWYGAPETKEKVPAMVLVHGGGGTAFDEWVRLWTSRGYAAIAMDTCGATPGGPRGKRPRHDHAGPPGWGGFDQIDQPVEDQWTYHAIADVLLAHSLIRSFPEVDAEKTGITGISWGGYLTCIAAGVDPRFKFAVPVYGCGFLGEDSAWVPTFEKMGVKAEQWLSLWDPSRYLRTSTAPMLWVTGTNDFAYPMNSLQKSYRLPPGERALAVRVRMAHAHGGPGEKPEEIHAFANALFRGGDPLPRIVKLGNGWVAFESKRPIVKAELNFTKSAGPWKARLWETVPAELDAAAGRAKAELPAGVKVYYFNLIDDRGLVVSSEHIEP